MLRRFQTVGSNTFLANYRPAFPTFSPRARMNRSLGPIWTALSTGDALTAYRAATDALEARPSASATERAGILAGLAGAEYLSGRFDQALRSARKSLDLVPGQWTARRIEIGILFRRQAYREAYEALAGLPVDLNGPSWDERMSTSDIEKGRAACAWLLGDWKASREHLDLAWPDGAPSMPEAVIEDCIRIEMAQDHATAAAELAALLVRDWGAERADELLQILVQRGFTADALPLYRMVFESHPDNELIRRRLVALCIKEGAIDEARRLAAAAALRSAA